jgi:peptidoglycan/xylan/chitin deacetylase (PgdA/CDA1 family)
MIDRNANITGFETNLKGHHTSQARLGLCQLPVQRREEAAAAHGKKEVPLLSLVEHEGYVSTRAKDQSQRQLKGSEMKLGAPWPRILLYHSIKRVLNDPNKIFTSPERFEAHMRYLKWRNLRGVSMKELYRAVTSRNARGMVGLTFDDGYEDFLHVALPILERFGFSATVFVIAGRLGGENDWKHYYEPHSREKLLGAEELRDVSERGIEVGSHGMSHAVLSGLETGRLEEEIRGSHQILGEVLDKEVEGFCYPYGSVDSAAVKAVRRSRRYAYACAVNMRVEHSVYDLPRIPIAELDHLARFATKLTVHPQYLRVKRAITSSEISLPQNFPMAGFRRPPP